MRVDVAGIGIEYEVTGRGRPVVLLHGFPDTGRLWRHQVPALAEAGFRVVAPDLRGYGRSDKPASVEAYSFVMLVGDVVAVLDDAGIDKTHVVGHDWGAALLGCWLQWLQSGSTTWWCCRSATRRPSGPASSNWKSRGTCCCSSSPRLQSSGWPATTGPTYTPGPTIPTPKPSSTNSRRTVRSRPASTITGPMSPRGSGWGRPYSCLLCRHPRWGSGVRVTSR